MVADSDPEGPPMPSEFQKTILVVRFPGTRYHADLTKPTDEDIEYVEMIFSQIIEKLKTRAVEEFLSQIKESEDD